MDPETNAMTSKTMDLSEATAAARAGGILSVTLKAHGALFYLELETQQGSVCTLVTTNGRKPRAFRKPEKAFVVVRDLGLDAGRFTLYGWRPDEVDFERTTRPDKSTFLKEAFAAGHDAWFRQAVLDSLHDDGQIHSHADAIEALYSGYYKRSDPEKVASASINSGVRVDWRDMAFFDARAIGQSDSALSAPACEQIDRQIAQLGIQPELGAPGRVDGTRELMVANTPYIAVYRVTPAVQIVRLLHATKRQPKWGVPKRRS